MLPGNDKLNNLNFVSKDLLERGQRVGYSSPLPSLSNNALSTSRTGGSGTTSSQFEFSKYDVAGLSYPVDLLGNNRDQEPKNYVIFYINVSVDSRVLRDKKEEVVNGVTRDLRGDLIGQKFTKTQVATASGAQGFIAGGGVGVIAGGKGLLGAAIGALSQAALVNVVSPSGDSTTAGDAAPGEAKAPTFTRPQKRLKKAIALHIPNNIRTGYNVSYGEAETAGFQALAKGAQEIGNALANRDKASMKQLGGVAGDILSAFAIKGTDKAVGIGAGLAANPKKEQAFESVDFRTFSFNYQFAPRNKEEARAIVDIIREFKYHMHPEFKEPSAFTYIYPSEFDIVYYFGTNENLNLHRHTSCVLTSMDIDYAPNGNFSTFDDGMPTQINVSLTFKELMVLSKETIERGL